MVNLTTCRQWWAALEINSLNDLAGLKLLRGHGCHRKMGHLVLVAVANPGQVGLKPRALQDIYVVYDTYVYDT